VEQKHYIAKVGNMWVNYCLHNIESVKLKSDKFKVAHLSQDKIDWLREVIPEVEIFEVKVTIEENKI
jgi:hypothetical protein